MSPVSAHYHLIFNTKLPPIDFSRLTLRMRENLRSRKRQTFKGVKVKKRPSKNFAQKKTLTIIASLQKQLIRLVMPIETNAKTVQNWLTFHTKLKILQALKLVKSALEQIEILV